MTSLIRALVADGLTSAQVAAVLGLTKRRVNKLRLINRIFTVDPRRSRRRH